jgi:hypothetical protein
MGQDSVETTQAQTTNQEHTSSYMQKTQVRTIQARTGENTISYAEQHSWDYLLERKQLLTQEH